MSIETRQWVCDGLVFTDDTQRSDLMDPTKTTTELIAFCEELLKRRSEVWYGKVPVNAVRTDHPTYDGPNGHSFGNAIDFGVVDAPLHFIQDVQACVDARGIGLGGVYQQYAGQCGGYNPDSKLFEDNSSNHLHVQVVGY